jgi:hypothetical protein
VLILKNFKMYTNINHSLIREELVNEAITQNYQVFKITKPNKHYVPNKKLKIN